MKVNVIVDPEDADLLDHAWHVNENKRRRNTGTGMPSRTAWVDGKETHLNLGRVILERKLCRKLKDDENAMHKNRNRADYRRSNLCVASIACVLAHRGKVRTRNGKPVASKYKGVYWYERDGKWEAGIRLAGCRKYLGRFTDETAAARAYDKAARDFFGRCAYQNFPEEARP